MAEHATLQDLPGYFIVWDILGKKQVNTTVTLITVQEYTVEVSK
jgi:hypothetical protein